MESEGQRNTGGGDRSEVFQYLIAPEVAGAGENVRCAALARVGHSAPARETRS